MINDTNVLPGNNDVLQNVNIPQQVVPQQIEMPNKIDMQVQSNTSFVSDQVNEQMLQSQGIQSNGINNNNSQVMQPNNNVMSNGMNFSQNNEQVQDNNMIPTNNGMNNMYDASSQVGQQNIPNVMDMKPNMSFVSEQNNVVMPQQELEQSNNVVQNEVGVSQNSGQVQVNNMMPTNNGMNDTNSQVGQSNISAMNFVSRNNNQNNNQ